MQRLLVPIDESPESWNAAEVAFSLARRTSCPVTLLSIDYDVADRLLIEHRLSGGLHARNATGVEVDIDVRIGGDSVAAIIESILEEQPGTTVVMSTHGRGRAAGILGSVADDVLQRTFGPTLLVGPHVKVDDFDGPVLITVDGSERSERAVPLGVAWATALALQPWIVHVRTKDDPLPPDTFDSGYVASVAHQAAELSGHEVEFEELHGRNAASTVADHARRVDAAMIVASSHGRTGLERMSMGSVVANIVRHAEAPVLVIRDLVVKG
ncbi:MAG: universal stress protein [Actinomycetota bacterium]